MTKKYDESRCFLFFRKGRAVRDLGCCRLQGLSLICRITCSRPVGGCAMYKMVFKQEMLQFMSAFFCDLKTNDGSTALPYSSSMNYHQQVRIVDAGRGHPSTAQAWGRDSPRWSAAHFEGGHRDSFPGQPSLLYPPLYCIWYLVCI